MSLQVGELQVAFGLDDSKYQAGVKAWKGQADQDGRQAGKALAQGVEQGVDQAGQAAKSGGKAAGEQFETQTEAGASGLSGKMEGLMDSLGPTLTAAAGALGLAVGGAFVASMVMDAEAASDKMAAQLGLDESSAKMAGESAGRVYAEGYGDSLDAVSEATAAVLSTGLASIDDTAEHLEGLTKNALDYAQAFDIDINKAVNSAGILMKSGLAKDGKEAFDLLVAASQKVPAQLREDVLDATDEYSQFFATLGISGTEAMDLLVKASEKGMYGIDKTGDALKELTIRSTDMSTTSVEAYRAAGLNAEEMARRFSQGGDSARGALDDLIGGLLGMEDPVKRSNAAIALFGTPLEDLNAQEVPTFLEGLRSMGGGLGKVTGKADKMGATLGDNLQKKLEAVKRRGFDLLLRGGEQLAEFFNDRVVPVFDWFVDNKPVLVGALTAGAVVIGSVLVPAFIAWAGAAWSAAAGVIAATWPVLAIAAAIGLLVAGLIYAYQNFGWFRSAVDAVASFLKDTLWPNFKAGVVILKDVLGRAISWLADVWTDTLWPALQAVGGWISQTLWPILQKIGDVIGQYVVAHVQTLAWVWSNVLWPALQLVWAFLSGPVKAAFEVLAQFIGDTLGPIVRMLAGLWTQVLWPALQVVARFITGTVAPVIGSIAGTMWDVVRGVGSAIGSVVDFFAGIGGRIGSAIGGLASTISSPFTSAFNAVKNLWNSTIGGVSFTIPDWVPGLGGRGWTFPKMHTGGRVAAMPGEGQEVLRLLRVGETVRTEAQERALQMGARAAAQLGYAGAGDNSSPAAASTAAATRGGNTWTGNQYNYTDADPDKIATATAWRLKTSGAA